MDWMRLYAEFATDPKVQMMSEAMQRRLIMLFCLQCGNGIETFYVTERETSIAFALRISSEEIADTKAEFVRRGFINDDWTLRNWGKRQYASDSSTARVRKHREAKKQDATEPCNKVKRSSNAPEQIQNRTEEEQSSLRSDSSSATPPTPPADLGKARSERLAQVTVEAIAAFNAVLGKPAGLLPAINPAVGAEKRRAQVKRCLRVASQICVQQFGGPTVTRGFWDAYWVECAMDEFKSGRQTPGKGHENWTPSFEYLTREAVMLEVFDRATSAGATA